MNDGDQIPKATRSDDSEYGSHVIHYLVKGTPKFIRVLNTRVEHERLSCLNALRSARRTLSFVI